jgi:hypothetical protein
VGDRDPRRVRRKELQVPNIEKDLWLEARHRTAQEAGKGASLAEQLFKTVSVSLPGAPVRQFFSLATVNPSVVFMPDLNKYRIRDLKMYYDAGCTAFMFRMGGPTRWVEGNWGYAIDPTFRPYMEQADKLGVLDQTIGYIVHNPFESWSVNGATGETIHTELIDEWTSGGYMPGAFMYDHEIDKCYRSTGAEVYVTEHNLVTSLAENTLNTWNKFKRGVSVYTAAWFMRQKNYWLRHETWFTNVNKPETEGGPGTQRPLHMAWYPKQLAGPYHDMDALASDMLKPTPEQISKFLYCGYRADLWQFTNAARLGTDTVGVDMNVSLAAHADTFWNTYRLRKPGGQPPPPPPPNDYEARITELEREVKTLKNIADYHAGQMDDAARALSKKMTM